MNVTFYSEKREFSSYPAVLLAASGIGGTSKGTSTRASTSGVSNVGATTQNNNNNEEEDEEEEECSRLHAQHSDHSHLRSTRRFMDDADMDAMDRATKGGVTGATENDDDDDDEFESSRRLRNQLYKRHHKTLRVNKSLPPKVTLNDVNDMVFETTATTTTNTTTTTTSTNTDDDDDGDGDPNNDEGEDGDDNVVTNTGQDNNKKPNTSGVTTTTEQQQQQGPFAQSSSFASSPTLTSHARSLRRPSDVSAIVHNNRRSDNNNNRKSDVIGPLSLPLKKNGGTRMNSTLGLMSCNTTDANTSCAVTPTTVVARKRNNEDEGMKNHSNLNESSEVTATEDEISSAILLTRNGTVTANHAADGHGNNNNNNIGLNKSISAAAIVSGGGNVNHLHQQHHHHSSARSHGGCSVAGGGMNTTTNSTAGSGIMGSTHDDIDDWNDYMLHEPSYAGGLAGSAHGSRPSGSGGPSDGGTGSGGPVNTSTSVPFPGSNNHAGEVNGGMALGGGGGMGSSLVGPTPGIAATRPGGGGGIVRPPGPLLFDDDESQLEKGEIPAVTTRMARFPLLSHISSRIGRTSCVGSSTNTATTSTTALTHGKRLGGSRRTAAFRSGGGIEEIHQGTLAEGLPVYSRDTIGRSRNLFGRGCGTGNGSKHGVEWLELSSPMEREELMDEVESVANKLNYDTRRVKGEDRIRCVKVLSHRKEMHMHIDFRSVNIPNEKCTVIRIVRPRSDRNRTDAWRYSHFYRELSETLNIRNIPLRN